MLCIAWIYNNTYKYIDVYSISMPEVFSVKIHFSEKKLIWQRNHMLLFEIYNMSENLKVFFCWFIRTMLEHLKQL